MKKLFLFRFLFTCLCLANAMRIYAQDTALCVPQVWGIVFGKAETTNDFLIYDACIPEFDSSLIFVVGKSQNADAFGMKRSEDSYFHEKDERTDAFLACFSTRGQLLWNTYLPAPDSNYLNAFASCVKAFENTILVAVNSYRINISPDQTRQNFPLAKGNLCLFEFSQSGNLVRSATFTLGVNNTSTGVISDFTYLPRIFGIDKTSDSTFLLTGHGLSTPGRGGFHGMSSFCSFPLRADWQTSQLVSLSRNSSSGYGTGAVEYWLSPNSIFSASFVRSVDPRPVMFCGLSSFSSSRLYKTGSESAGPQIQAIAPDPFPIATFSFPQGHNRQQRPLFVEHWNSYARYRSGKDYFYMRPISTMRYDGMDDGMYTGAYAFSGSVQNTCDIDDYILVEGIHCQNYQSEFFKSNESTYRPYSHDTVNPIPTSPGRFQTRKSGYTAVPFLLLYNQDLFSKEDSVLPAPEWGGFLNADWLYHDLFLRCDLATPENYYLPAGPLLLTSGKRFFVIGNAKTIGQDNLRGSFQCDEIQAETHHQGFLSGFRVGCPPALAHFLVPDKFCPGDSTELSVGTDYEGYLFVFADSLLQSGAISVSADSSQAWAKQEGSYHAFLTSRIEGCADARTDTVTVRPFDMEWEGNYFLPRDSILCAHLDLDLQLPEDADDFHCFWLDRDSIVLPFGEDTTRFTISGMRGTDGLGANTDTRNPRFFQLALFHKHCPAVFFDTLLVYDQVKPTFELPFHDTVICLDEPVILDSLNPLVYKPFYSFEWNNGKSGSDFSFSETGAYMLRFSIREDFAFCGYDTASDSVYVVWSDPALTLISIPEDTTFCENNSIELNASVPFSSTRYSWQEGNLEDLFSPTEDSSLFTTPFIEVDKDASYGLFLLDTLGCLNSRQVNLREEDCRPKLEIPNVFTPNGDGVNDVWKFTELSKCFQVDILVVDRKGSHVLHEKVRSAEDFSWNGCFKNGSRKMPDGPYFYVVTYKDAYGKNKVQSGSVTILGTAE